MSKQPHSLLSICSLPLFLFVLLFAPSHAQPSPDFDNNGEVGFSDFILFTQKFGTQQGDTAYDAKFDLDNNSSIGFGDFIVFTQQFGQTVSPNNITQKIIDPNLGGTLTLDNGLEITIPINALSGTGTLQVEPITLTEDQEPQNRLTDVFDIQLTQADIRAPVEIAIPYNPSLLPPEATLETLFLAYWDGEHWRPQPSTVDAKTIRAKVDHFSIWSGVFSSTPSAVLFTSIPDTLTLFPRGEESLTIQFIVNPANNNLSDLRVRLGLSLTDSITTTAPGKITLRDNGTSDQNISEPIPGLKVRSVDTQPLDGIFGVELTADGGVISPEFNGLIANATITTRRIASIAVDTAITIPIKRLAFGHIISGQVTKDNTGVADATVILSGPTVETATTDADGRYRFAELDDGIYTLTPSKADHIFTPPSRTIALAGKDLFNINFEDLLSSTGFSAGQALQINNNGHLTIPVTDNSPLTLTDAFTIEAWIQPKDRESRIIASYWGSDTGQWLLGTRELAIRGNGETATLSLESATPLDSWTHYALTFENNLLTFYLNGRQIEQTVPGIANLFAQTAADAQIRIGNAQSGTELLSFEGLIDEVRIWNRARSAREIRDEMHKGFGSASALTQNTNQRAKQSLAFGLIGYWNFNTQNDDGTLPDLSGQNNHGILNGNAQQATSEAPIAALGGNPILQIFPSEILTTGDAAIEIALSNVGSGQLVWTIDEEQTWLRVTSLIGDTGGDGSFYGGSAQTLTFHLSEAGLDGGTHNAVVNIWSSGGLLEVPISLNTTFTGSGSGSSIGGQEVGIYTTPAGTTHEMITIPEGEFTMGSNLGERNAQPAHTVYLSTYQIDRFEVTNLQYQAFVQTTNHRPSEFAQNPSLNVENLPITGIAWLDADAYCQWIGGRLPTEAEWEKAARGIDGRTYPWGETSPDPTLLNYKREINQPVAVGSYPTGVSPFGLHDMAGNVWEWTNDWISSTYYIISPDRNPTGPSNGSQRVIRGGSWGEDQTFVRTFNRFWSAPNASTDLIGFRCVIPEQQ